jgi:predicted dehydrogenase
VEQHIHNLDVSNWLKNSFPVTAQGQGGRQVRTEPKYGQIFDHHMVEYTYADGTKMLSQCRHVRGAWPSVSEHAHGTRGNATISAATIYDSSGERAWRFGKGGGNGHQQELHDLFASLRNGEIPNEGEYGALSTMTAIMGRLATYSGQVIHWDEALQSELDLSPETYSFDATPPVVPDADGFYPVAVPGITRVI